MSWEIRYADNTVTHPFGKDAIGQILYTDDGRMSATVSRVDRQSVNENNIRRASSEDKSRLFDSFFHYAGKWRLEGQSVVHDIDMALNVNMVGTRQKRHAEFNHDCTQLVLSANEDLGDRGIRKHHITWGRN